LQVDDSVSEMYALAFQALYRSCQRRSNKLHRLEAALQWHMARGVLQVGRALWWGINTMQ
jgi:hypothetical protein